MIEYVKVIRVQSHKVLVRDQKHNSWVIKGSHAIQPDAGWWVAVDGDRILRRVLAPEVPKAG